MTSARPCSEVGGSPLAALAAIVLLQLNAVEVFRSERSGVGVERTALCSCHDDCMTRGVHSNALTKASYSM
jgi:hypothetical protein